MTGALTPAECRVLEEVDRHNGYIRQADVVRAHIRPHALLSLAQRGVLERVRRGLYRRSDLTFEGDLGLLDASIAAPNGVICLLSALALYELTTATPWEVYMAIPRSTQPPHIVYPPVRFVRYGDRIFNYGIEDRTFAGSSRTIRVYSPEKSISDAMHFARLVGPQAAVEALQEYMRRPERDLIKLREAGRVCRVSTEIEAMLSVLA
jgi:predicted transcriptional regulator of viral defense system